MSVNSTANETLFGTVAGTVYPLPGDQCLFRVHGAQQCRVLTSQVLQALEVCGRYRSMDAHVSAVTGAIKGLRGREEAVRQVLDDLAEKGLLESAADRLTALREAADADPGPVKDVVIRSAGGGALPRLLESLGDNERRYGNRYRYWVVDDAHDADGRALLERAVPEAVEAGLDCRLLGREWQTEFVRRLLEDAGTPQAGWLFEPDSEEAFTGGRAWNLALLAMAGRRFLMLDDDLVCAPRTQPDLGGSLRLSDTEWSLWFHAGPGDAADAGAACDFDPLARHGALLGRTLGDAVSGLAAGEDDLQGLDSRALASLPARGRVVATDHGTYGDAASTTNLWYYTATGESRQRFWASREDYDTFRRSRWVTRVRDGHGLHPRPTFTPAGLDGRCLLPPTLPCGRNEDFLFGALLGRAHPRDRAASFPWALGHFPDSPRRWLRDAHDAPITPDAARFAADHLSLPAGAGDAATPASRLALAADQLAGLGDEPTRELWARLDEYLLYVRSDLVQQLQRQLSRARGAPVYWVADVRRIVETHGRALIADDPPRLAGMPGDDVEAERWLRQRLSRFAAGLAAWPALYEAARESGGAGD